MKSSLLNKNGATSVYAILILMLVTLGGLSLLFIAKRDRTNSSDYVKIKSSTQAAMSAIQACEGKFLNHSAESFDLLIRYNQDNSYQWFLNTTDEATSEKFIEMWNGNNAPKYSAKIIGFDPTNFLIKIEGRGCRRHSSIKPVIATYQLNGLGSIPSNKTKYVLYIKKDGYDFNQNITINGDVYFGGGFRFNSNSNGTIINGNFKSGKSNTVSEFNGAVTIKENAFIQTPIKLQNSSLTVEGKSGFEKYLELHKDLILKDNGFFNGYITGCSGGDVYMNNHAVLHSGSCTSGKFKDYTSFQSNGGTIDLASKVILNPGDFDPPTEVDIESIPSIYIKDFSSLGFIEFSGINLQSTYVNTPESEKWKGYLVVRISASDPEPTFYNGTTPFGGKVVLIVERALSVNGNWYRSCPTSETLLYVTDGGIIYQLGWNGYLRAYINVSGNGRIDYSFNVGSQLKGAIHHVSDNAQFQANSSNLFQLTYDESLITSLSAAGLINESTVNGGSFKLVDARIRPQLLSVYQL